jgi:arabinose-5-phosphate isomerase
MGRAPTTSKMAPGDVIAIALLTRHGFTASDFCETHPGGRPGGTLHRAREVMHTGDAIWHSSLIRLWQPLVAMNAHERPVTVLFVVDAAGKPLGILHVHDLLRMGIA